MIKFIVILLYLFSIFLISIVFKKFYEDSREIVRKIIHIGIGPLIPIALYLKIDQNSALIFTGIIGSVANILLTVSLRFAEASLVTPTKYLNLVFAILLGYFIWGEIPKVLTLSGAGLIIVSSVIIFMRESQLKKQVVSPRP